jgi:Tfp pilus tip-associated adhesin PilY1
MPINKLTTASIALISLLLLASGAPAATTNLASSPLSGASSVDIAPNILFVLDDSDSMDLDSLPDWALSTEPHQSRNPGFNGISYNPGITYTPPKYFDINGAVDNTTYPPQTSLNSSEWTTVPDDGYGIQNQPPRSAVSNQASNLVGNAYYYTTLPGEYCTNASMKTCVAASTPSTTYPVAATLRWCKTAAAAAATTPTAGDCQATQIDPSPAATPTNTPFTFPRIPSPRVSTITIIAGSSTSVSSITVDGLEILSGSTNARTSATNMAADIAGRINDCSFGLTGSCGVAGYRAVDVDRTVVISAPGIPSGEPVIIQSSGSMSFTPTVFARPSINLAPGENLLTVITSTTTTYPKAAGRSDCLAVANACSYAEEMTNYANWWAYYRTRMQSMKTATSLSFDPIDSTYRVGYMSINNNTSTDFQNIGTFDAAQKKAWYDKLFAATPGQNTPLRIALANAGRLYAGRLNNTTFNGVSVVDPVQFYCQQNVTILSTDGYWNEGPGYEWDGVTAVGDQDGPGLEVRPQLDDGSPQIQIATRQVTRTRTPSPYTQPQTRTEQRQSRTAQLETRTFSQPQASTTQLQSQDAQWQSRTSALERSTYTQQQVSTLTQPQEQVSQLETREGRLQSRRSDLQTQTKTRDQERTAQLQRRTATVESKTYQLQQQLIQVQQQTSSNGGTNWTGWSNVASCSPQLSGTNRTACRTLAQSGWNDVSSCTVVAYDVVVTNPGTDLERTTYTTGSACQYTSPAWTSAASCTPIARSPGPTNYPVGTAVDCQTSGTTSWSNVSACTTSATVECQYAWTGWSDSTSSCTPVTPSSASPYTVGFARECRYDQWTSWTDSASSCTPVANEVKCRYKDWTGWSNTASCTDVAASTSPPYTVTQAWECRVNYPSTWTAVPTGSTCTEVTSGARQRQCQYGGFSGTWANVGSCTPAAPSTNSPYTVTQARICQTVWTTATNTTTCTPNASTQCTTTWTPFATVSSCTAVANATQCQYSPWSGWSNIASCTAVPQSSGPSYTIGIATECQPTWPNPWVDVTSCTVTPTRQCQYSAASPWIDVASCSSLAQSPASPFTVGVATDCQTAWTDWSATASCTPAAGATECRTTWPNTWVNAASCTVEPDITDCRDEPIIAAWTNVASCTAGTNPSGLTTFCQDTIVTPSPTSDFVDPNPLIAYQDEAASAANGHVATTYTTATTGPIDVSSCIPVAAAAPTFLETTCPTRSLGATPDTLADVAEYYWKTDLRDPALLPDRCTGGPVVSGSITTYNDVCTNDTNTPKQLMNTYTLGLGASGLMQYQKDYLTATSGDFYSIEQGLIANPATGLCSWQGGGPCNWPEPESNEQSNIDDLWHAAVNGRGTYFSASDPSSLAAGISGALATVTVRGGALASVTVASANLASGDNSIFAVSFKAGEWSGEVVKRTIDGETGVLSATPTWSAQEQLDALVTNGTHAARTIYTRNPGGASASGAADNLKFFLWANLTAAEQAYFATAAIDTLTQFCTTGTICLSATTQASASGEPLVDFIRGAKTNEGAPSNLSAYYRERTHFLGDIVGSEAVYVQGSPWNYADYNYGAFKAANQSRAAMIYTGSNDGMLHAFDALTGDEVWAYIPTMVMPKLFKLADKNYGAPGRHQFLVDGTPVMGEICVSDCTAPASGTLATVWKTILVGGLNNGGRGYYALDVTDPAAPKSLWEFTHDNLGYTYGNPVITKLKDGTWVVIVTSGYNNVSPGDGSGYLFVLNANTGALIRTINTNVGDATTPSGLARIAGWANYPDSNNTSQRVYGGDLLGNLWRFDVNGDIPLPAVAPALPVYDAQRLATLLDPSGVPQPITSKPELGKVSAYPVVFVGTGQLLGTDDLVTAQINSLYAIKDRLTDTDYGSPRPLSPAQTVPTPGDFVAQTLTSGICPAGNEGCTAGDPIVTATNNAVDFALNDGWYIDLPVAGERINTDLRLQLGTLTFNSNRPTTGACVPVGVSFVYALDYRTGGYVEGTSGPLGRWLADALSSAATAVSRTDGTKWLLIQTDKPSIEIPPLPEPLTPRSARRISWRELVGGQ